MIDNYRPPTTDDRPQTAEERPAGAYEVRCPNCHALQFLARAPWECVAIDEATVAIKCWRRTCKRVLGLRPVGATDRKGQLATQGDMATPVSRPYTDEVNGD